MGQKINCQGGKMISDNNPNYRTLLKYSRYLQPFLPHAII
uniref:Uncharacterized protein n=1 Tax=Anguilla anguilla TaxID=7936 RepID=A0A0E9VNQ6_ANGAN